MIAWELIKTLLFSKAGLAVMVVVGLAIALGAYHHSAVSAGKADERAKELKRIHEDCGEKIEDPQGCLNAGKKIAEDILRPQLAEAEESLKKTAEALAEASARTEALRVEGERRIAEAKRRGEIAAKAAATANARVAQILATKPSSEDPCVASCQFLRQSH